MTANGDLLRQLFRGYIKRDDEVFRSAAEELVRVERLKNHRLLADDLMRILLNGNGAKLETKAARNAYNIPKDRERGFPLLDIAEFSLDWNRLILPSQTSQTLIQIAREHQRKDILVAGGMRPTQRVLFYGPPGCGKTLAAQVLASVLTYPLVTVRFDAVVSSYLGETASNLRRVFDFINRGHWVVLFDEFDAIGKDRDNPFEHGELKRVVNSLLQLMDAFRGDSLLIAATNHESLLDNAIWRRFEKVIGFELPTEQDRVLLLQLFLQGFDTAEIDFHELSRKTGGSTGSDLEQLSIEVARQALLQGRNRITREDINSSLESLNARLAILRSLSAPTHPPSDAQKVRATRKERHRAKHERPRPSRAS